jgi:hypothetical protein
MIGWDKEDWLRKHIPRCPEAGTYSWSVDVREVSTESVAYAERLMVERNWTHVERLHLGHVHYINGEARLKDYSVTVTGRCIPGTYDPVLGRIEPKEAM